MYIYMNRSSNRSKQTYSNFIGLVQLSSHYRLTGNLKFASNLPYTLHAYRKLMLFLPLFYLTSVLTSLPQPTSISARTYNFQSIPLTICNKEYSPAVKKGINQWHVCGCILNLRYIYLWSFKLTQSY